MTFIIHLYIDVIPKALYMSICVPLCSAWGNRLQIESLHLHVNHYSDLRVLWNNNIHAITCTFVIIMRQNPVAVSHPISVKLHRPERKQLWRGQNTSYVGFWSCRSLYDSQFSNKLQNLNKTAELIWSSQTSADTLWFMHCIRLLYVTHVFWLLAEHPTAWAFPSTSVFRHFESTRRMIPEVKWEICALRISRVICLHVLVWFSARCNSHCCYKTVFTVQSQSEPILWFNLLFLKYNYLEMIQQKTHWLLWKQQYAKRVCPSYYNCMLDFFKTWLYSLNIYDLIRNIWTQQNSTTLQNIFILHAMNLVELSVCLEISFSESMIYLVNLSVVMWKAICCGLVLPSSVMMQLVHTFKNRWAKNEIC